MVLLSHLKINELSVYYATTGSISFFASTENYSDRQGHEILSFVPGLPGWFFQRLVYGGVLPPPHSPRQAQGCGFPHTQVAKRTAPSRQSLQKRFHGLASTAPAFWGIIEENRRTVTSKKATLFLMQRSARSNRRGLFSSSHVSSSYHVSGIQD
jgi:hypothetical protein